eukprot:CAMPEP_0174251372 /NCGR_PEP_ID=MMETSP0439-20130205/1217_1 /TAXON_ID=0 /ORGANISM="Stereomyxa ramosa, Strain Chinc5" /LENGTH=388 /DNA_ID=CAMNT_0015331665 /DNA_START=120 /DNA_END=1283 /DNA_ORIENTATION=+
MSGFSDSKPQFAEKGRPSPILKRRQQQTTVRRVDNGQSNRHSITVDYEYVMQVIGDSQKIVMREKLIEMQRRETEKEEERLKEEKLRKEKEKLEQEQKKQVLEVMKAPVHKKRNVKLKNFFGDGGSSIVNTWCEDFVESTEFRLIPDDSFSSSETDSSDETTEQTEEKDNTKTEEHATENNEKEETNRSSVNLQPLDLSLADVVDDDGTPLDTSLSSKSSKMKLFIPSSFPLSGKDKKKHLFDKMRSPRPKASSTKFSKKNSTMDNLRLDGKKANSYPNLGDLGPSSKSSEILTTLDRDSRSNRSSFGRRNRKFYKPKPENTGKSEIVSRKGKSKAGRPRNLSKSQTTEMLNRRSLSESGSDPWDLGEVIKDFEEYKQVQPQRHIKRS